MLELKGNVSPFSHHTVVAYRKHHKQEVSCSLTLLKGELTIADLEYGFILHSHQPKLSLCAIFT